MEKSKRLTDAFDYALDLAFRNRYEFLTPEHLLAGILQLPELKGFLDRYSVTPELVESFMAAKISAYTPRVPESLGQYQLTASAQLSHIMVVGQQMAASAGNEEVDVSHIINAIFELEDSLANKCIASIFTADRGEFLSELQYVVDTADPPEPEDDLFDFDPDDDDQPSAPSSTDNTLPADQKWRSLVTCINDRLADHNPLIGRQAELDRTIQVLCRRDKNNPLHVGEPGVGKTALVYGLAERIQRFDVPERLFGCRIYQMDMASMVAGTSYRGDFEKRIKSVLDGALAEGNAIIYIDEIHTLIGAGATSDGALDGANILKPYLEGTSLRFIGSTTYEEHKRFFQHSGGMMRRFQQIDIPEPSIDETVAILEGLKKHYESYHGVRYADGVLRYAAEAAARHINGRFLPDKAIDLIDEAGAYRVMNPIFRKARSYDKDVIGEWTVQKTQWVNRDLINDVIARLCKIDPRSLHDDDTQDLETLSRRMKAQIYGQDEAIRQVTEAVQMGKAGLLDDQKPVASLLFVGPTGVGKTEVCRVLAKELGIELVRFDMSEYTEKHTVAKLIGSPAGYVGYEDGGLLTDAIRKTPHCVLLLDEIEKAHSDIYNILLQVMDYARLTDNKGQRADFRHVILVMTSNAGAQFAHQASVGFGANVSAGEAMLNTVKKTFKPEFLARLSGTVVFRDMDREMASLILDKKLSQLSDRLKLRNVTLELTPAAHDFLLDRGYNQRLGAREMDRQINQLLAPLLMRKILFGTLKKGGSATIDIRHNELVVAKG